LERGLRGAKRRTYATQEMFLEVEFEVWHVFLDNFHDLFDSVLAELLSSLLAVCLFYMAPDPQLIRSRHRRGPPPDAPRSRSPQSVRAQS